MTPKRIINYRNIAEFFVHFIAKENLLFAIQKGIFIMRAHQEIIVWRFFFYCEFLPPFMARSMLICRINVNILWSSFSTRIYFIQINFPRPMSSDELESTQISQRISHSNKLNDTDRARMLLKFIVWTMMILLWLVWLCVLCKSEEIRVTLNFKSIPNEFELCQRYFDKITWKI